MLDSSFGSVKDFVALAAFLALLVALACQLVSFESFDDMAALETSIAIFAFTFIHTVYSEVSPNIRPNSMLYFHLPTCRFTFGSEQRVSLQQYYAYLDSRLL
jgi:hypothetical protein